MKKPQSHKDFDAEFDDKYPLDGGEWYVMRATYGRAEKAAQICEEKCDIFNCKCYVPYFKKYKEINGRVRKVRDHYLDNLLYVYAHREVIDQIAADTGDLSFVKYYYNHFSLIKGEPLLIRRSEMKNFMRAMFARSDEKYIVSAEIVHYRSGDLVEVTDGPFKKVQGRIARVMGQQRLVIDIGENLMVTSYIANPIIKVIEEGKFD